MLPSTIRQARYSSSMHRLRWLLPCLAMIPTLARAEELPEEASAPRRTALQVILGGGTPLGDLGVELERSLAQHVWLGAGVGLAVGGPQVAVMPRYVFDDGVASLALGLGLSGGPHRWREGWGWCFDDCAERSSDFAIWANAEAAVVAQWPGGFRMRFFAGYGLVLNPGSIACDGDDSDPSGDHCRSDHASDGERLPSVGAAVGYAFE